MKVEEIIKNLEYFSVDENMKSLSKWKKSKQSKPKGCIWEIKKGIRPVDLYCYLNGRFGPPNGIQMLFRSNDSDNLIHWHYTFKYKEHHIDVMCMTFRLEIIHDFDFKNQDDAKDEFISKIKDDFSNYHKEIANTRSRIEKWNLFINPFFRIKSVIEHQLNKLDELDLDNKDTPTHPTDPNRFEEWKNKMSEISESYTEATSLGLNIRMLAPVYAESFINLLIFLLAKKDIKNDKRLYESVIRQQIDIRVKTLHLNCEGFFQPVDYSIEICKKFHSLMNNRNDLLHGNIDPNRSFYDTVFFEDKIPLFTEFRDFNFYSWEASIKNVTPDLAIEDYQIVQNFIAYVLICLDRNIYQEVRQFMETNNPGWNETTNRPGILFPSHIVDFRPQFATGDLQN